MYNFILFLNKKCQLYAVKEMNTARWQPYFNFFYFCENYFKLSVSLYKYIKHIS